MQGRRGEGLRQPTCATNLARAGASVSLTRPQSKRLNALTSWRKRNDTRRTYIKPREPLGNGRGTHRYARASNGSAVSGAFGFYLRKALRGDMPKLINRTRRPVLRVRRLKYDPPQAQPTHRATRTTLPRAKLWTIYQNCQGSWRASRCS